MTCGFSSLSFFFRDPKAFFGLKVRKVKHCIAEGENLRHFFLTDEIARIKHSFQIDFQQQMTCRSV